MDYINYLEELKFRLILLNLQSVLNLVNIKNFDLFLNDMSDDNVYEAFHKLLKIDFKNKISLYSVINDINMGDVDLFDLDDQVSLLMSNYTLQDQYFFNIISYLLIVEDYSINGEDLVTALDEFLDMDSNYLKEFNNNYKMLEKIREER